MLEWLAIALVFGRAINGEWLFDDPTILDQGETQRPAPAPRFSRYWVQKGFLAQVVEFHRDARGLTHMMFSWEWKLFGFRRRWAWHAVNLLFHGLAFTMARHVAGAILGPDRGLIAALIFALHPHQVTTACYISGRAGLLAGFFTLAGLAHFLEGNFGLAALSQYFAWKSKQDAFLLLALYPMVYFWRG